MEDYNKNEEFSIGKSQSNTLKGLAIIFVVMSHIPRIYPELNLSMLNPLGYIGVGIFLCLSGYGLQKSYDKYGLDGFWKKRIQRIIPALTITTIWIVIIAAFNGIPFNLYQIIASCLGLSNSVNSVTWYILMTWFCYVIFYSFKRNNVRNLIGGGYYQFLFF